jgi:hypothetical protein
LPSQNVEVFLDEFENKSCKELEFLSKLLREQGFNYSICDVDRLCHDRGKVIELQRFERSLHKKEHKNFSDIDTMTGYEFEDFLITLFTNLGYTVEQRKKKP